MHVCVFVHVSMCEYICLYSASPPPPTACWPDSLSAGLAICFSMLLLLYYVHACLLACLYLWLYMCEWVRTCLSAWRYDLSGLIPAHVGKHCRVFIFVYVGLFTPVSIYLRAYVYVTYSVIRHETMAIPTTDIT